MGGGSHEGLYEHEQGWIKSLIVSPLSIDQHNRVYGHTHGRVEIFRMPEAFHGVGIIYQFGARSDVSKFLSKINNPDTIARVVAEESPEYLRSNHFAGIVNATFTHTWKPRSRGPPQLEVLAYGTPVCYLNDVEWGKFGIAQSAGLNRKPKR